MSQKISQTETLLTIGIPVYNGEHSIADLINSIVIPAELLDKVEILFSDNCSTDGTAEIIKTFEGIKYFRNPNNVGYDRNMHNIFEKASGKFVWTIGADDLILSRSAIENICNLIKDYPNLGLICVTGNEELIEDHIAFHKDENFFICSKFSSGFISANVIKRDLWLASNPSAYFNSGWIHFGITLEIAHKFTSIVTKVKLVDENPKFSKREKDWNTNGSGLLIMLKLVEIFINMPNMGYSKKMRRAAKMLIKRSYPQQIIKAKAFGLQVNLDIIKTFINCYKEFFTFWVIDLPSLVMPSSVCKIIYNESKKKAR